MAKRWIVVHGVVVLALLAMLAPPLAAQPAQFANAQFQQLWQQFDQPVVAGQTDRQFTWGPNTFFMGPEQYVESPGGQRVVQYFDKSRMEMNNPATGNVSNGLLVREMVSGRMTLGDVAFEQRAPSHLGVAGDPVEINPGTVTYSDFGNVASIDANRVAPNRTGQVVNQGMGANGVIFEIPQATIDQYQQNHVQYGFYEPTLGHNMANVFVDFVNQRGTLFINGQFQANQPVYSPWMEVMGLPITEPFWTRTRVGGVYQIVLVQLFERRALTYTPSNRAGAQVEMGNVGQHYFTWRTQPPPPPPPPQPTPLPQPNLPLPPTFTSGPQRTNLTTTSATIEWATSTPTTSTVEFDTDANRDPYRNTVGTSGFRNTHSVTLGGLAPDTTYFWRVIGQDEFGQRVPENNHSFRTPPTTGGGTTITQPAAGARVTSPLTVSGQEDGTAFNNVVVVRLRDPHTGHVFAETATTVQGGGVGRPGPYTATLFYTAPSADQSGVIEVVSIPPQEGQPEQLKASINVTIVGTNAPPPPPSGSNTITRPTTNQRVGSPLRVLGTVDNLVQNGNIVVNLRDRTNGVIVASMPGQANSRGEFDVLINYTSPAPDTPALAEVVAPEQTNGQRNVVKASVMFIMA